MRSACGHEHIKLDVLAINAAVDGNPTADTLFMGVRKERVERKLCVGVDLRLECHRCRRLLEIDAFVFVACPERGELAGAVAVTRGSTVRSQAISDSSCT